MVILQEQLGLYHYLLEMLLSQSTPSADFAILAIFIESRMFLEVFQTDSMVALAIFSSIR
jgi:hypothetical protein